DRFRLEAYARAAGAGERDGTSERGAERRADAGDLVLGLESIDVEVLQGRQLLQDVACRRDRIAAEEEWAPDAARRGDEAERGGGVAGDIPIAPGRDARRTHGVRGAEHLGRLAEIPPGLEHAHVGFGERGRLFEARLDPLDGRLDWTVEE